MTSPQSKNQMEPYDWLKDISNLEELMDANPKKEVSLDRIHTNLTFEGDPELLVETFALEFSIRGLPVFLYASKKLSTPTLGGLKANRWSELKNKFVNNEPFPVDEMHLQNQSLKPLYAALSGTNPIGILYYYLTNYTYAFKTKLEKMELLSDRFLSLRLTFMGKTADIYAKLDPSVDAKLFVERKTSIPDQKVGTTVNPQGVAGTVKPLAFLTQANCEKQKQRIVLGKMLGKGTFSQVSEAKVDAKEPTFGYALKVSSLENPDADLDVLERDNYFLHVLKPARFEGKPIVPKLIESWICNEQEEKLAQKDTTDFNKERKITAYTLLERWDGDMAYLGEQRTGSRLFAFTKKELTTMFRLALILGELGVVHGDLKPDQFLYRQEGKDIVVADFGFAGGRGYKYQTGLMGWPSQRKVLACPYAFTPLKCPSPCESPSIYIGYCQYQNVMQLELSLLFNETYVVEEEKKFELTNLTRFAGLGAGWIRKSGFNPCSGYSDEFVTKTTSKAERKFVLPLTDFLLK